MSTSSRPKRQPRRPARLSDGGDPDFSGRASSSSATPASPAAAAAASPPTPTTTSAKEKTSKQSSSGSQSNSKKSPPSPTKKGTSGISSPKTSSSTSDAKASSPAKAVSPETKSKSPEKKALSPDRKEPNSPEKADAKESERKADSSICSPEKEKTSPAKSPEKTKTKSEAASSQKETSSASSANPSPKKVPEKAIDSPQKRLPERGRKRKAEEMEEDPLNVQDAIEDEFGAEEQKHVEMHLKMELTESEEDCRTEDEVPEQIPTHETVYINVNEDSDMSTEVKEKAPIAAAGLGTEIAVGQGTIGRCGECIGCQRQPCRECSACERKDFTNCIDTYCLGQESGRAQRLAMKELYIRSMGANRGQQVKSEQSAVTHSLPAPIMMRPTSTITTTPPAQRTTRTPSSASSRKSSGGSGDEDDDRENESKALTPKTPQSGSKPRNTNYVYGSGRHSSKSRRCGECEGCMKDDCGECTACLDKPRFGGKGTKKRACITRVCRMKQAGRLGQSSDGKKSKLDMEDA